jgi:hypothetical protein
MEGIMGRMNGLVLAGIVLAIIGIAGLAYPMFTTSQTKDVANIGSLDLQSTENTSHNIPPMVSGGILVLGIVLAGAGVSRKS